MCVPQVVQPDAGELGGSGRLLELVADGFWVDGGAVDLAHDKVLVVVLGAHREAFFELPGAMRAQGCHGGWVQRHGAPPLGSLWCSPGHPGCALALNVSGDEGLGDPQAVGLGVDVAPAKPERLASAHAGVRKQPPATA